MADLSDLLASVAEFERLDKKLCDSILTAIQNHDWGEETPEIVRETTEAKMRVKRI